MCALPVIATIVHQEVLSFFRYLVPMIAGALIGLFVSLSLSFIAETRRQHLQRLKDQRDFIRQLKVSEERLSVALNASNDGLFDWNVKTGDVFFSPRFADILGYREGELAGTSEALEALVHPHDRTRLASLVDDFISGALPAFDTEFQMKHKDGHFLTVLLRASLLHGENGDLRFIGTMLDVSARRTLQDEKDAAIAASRAKSAFLANMSHEICTPMNGVLGMSELLFKTELDHAQREMLSTIQSSSKTLIRIISDILDMSKIEAGELEMDPQPVDLTTLAQEVVELMLPAADSRNVRLAVSFSDDVYPYVSLDGERLKQVLFNLVSNAVKFSDGNLRDEMGRVTLGVTQWDDTSMIFTVNDNGIGIAPEKLPYLFRPFTQADEGTSRVFGGTGLGLSISRRLAELMGGSLTAESTLGEGATFFLRVPVRKVDPSEVCTLVEPPDYGRARLLVTTQASTFVKRLSQCGRRFGYALSRHEDLDGLVQDYAACSQEPVAVLTEESLPHIDEIRARLAATGRPVRILMASKHETIVRLRREADMVTIRRYPLLPSNIAASLEWLLNDLGISEKSAINSVVPKDDLGGRKRILLVEDNAVNRLVIGKQLEALGYDFETAEDGVLGLSKLETSSEFDLILTDCHMPNMDGFEMTRRFRAGAGTAAASMPIIAITANAMDGEAQACLDAGMNSYLSKPVSIEQLSEALEKHMG
jgi:PAS domain S-box-containing protein